MRTKGKTVRFVKLVEKSGRPERAVLWVAPEKDGEFMKAVRQNRVVSVKEENVGTKKDFGIVGFEKGSAYLVFPKALKAKAGEKVVGLKYELLAASKPKDPVSKASVPKRKKKEAREHALPKPTPKYRVVVTGTKEFVVEVEAKEEKMARNIAVERVKTGEDDVRTVDMELKVKSVRKVKG